MIEWVLQDIVSSSVHKTGFGLHVKAYWKSTDPFSRLVQHNFCWPFVLNEWDDEAAVKWAFSYFPPRSVFDVEAYRRTFFACYTVTRTTVPALPRFFFNDLFFNLCGNVFSFF